MNIQNRPIPSILQVQNEHFKNNRVTSKKNIETDNFHNILQQRLEQKENIKFSKHANIRLNARNINFTKDQLDRINQGVFNAEQKGIKESLVLIDNVALVVNIENKTVVTAIDKDEAKEQIFTNIDGAVLI